MRLLGLQVVGPGRCRDTNVVREFLYKNFVPFTWFDPETEEGQRVFQALGSPKKTPVIALRRRQCPDQSLVDRVGPRRGHLEVLPCAGCRFRHRWGRTCGDCGGRVCLFRRSFDFDARSPGAWRTGGRIVADRELHRLSGRTERRRPGDARSPADAQIRRRIVAPVTVEKLTPAKTADDRHILHLDCGAEIKSRVVLLALGVRWRRLEAEGVERFTGAGIYYACTTVEADLYDGSDVAVVGAGNSAGQAIMFLAECCPGRTVHALIRHKLGPGMSEYLTNRIRSAANVVVHEETEIDAVFGDRHIEEITLKGSNGAANKRLPCCGGVRVYRSRTVGRMAAVPNCTRRQRLSAHGDRRDPFRFVAAARTAILARWRRLFPACWRPAIFVRDRPSASDSRWATGRWP